MKNIFRKNTFCLAVLLLAALSGHPAAAQQPAGNVAAPAGQMIACPMYAMKCPDGSFVSPTGPDCHLPPCPGSQPGAPAPAPPFKCPPNAVCAQPLQPLHPICNMGPMKCPDGSFVAPGPDCKFGPCPGSAVMPDPDANAHDGDANEGDDAAPDSAPPQTGPAVIGTGSGMAGVAVSGPARVVNMSDLGLSRYPDNPLPYVPSGPQTAQFVVEHRSALNGQQVTIRGVIVSAVKGGCPSNPMMGMPCMLPRVAIADSDSAGRDKNYDVQVILPMDDKTAYETGQTLDFTGAVSGTASDVSIRKD